MIRVRQLAHVCILARDLAETRARMQTCATCLTRIAMVSPSFSG